LLNDKRPKGANLERGKQTIITPTATTTTTTTTTLFIPIHDTIVINKMYSY